MKFKIFSFFSGCGLLDLGFENNNFSIEFVNELSSSFIFAYKFSRIKLNSKQPKYGYDNIDVENYLKPKYYDLKKYINDAKEKNSLIGFIGGPPCPDFSIAGKQKGRFGDNGKLSMSYIQLIVQHKPDFFLFENVKGLLQTKKHRQFYSELKSILSNNDYHLTDRLINALEFGVPQNRERILLFGVNKKILLNTNEKYINNFNWTAYTKYSVSDLMKIEWPKTNPFKENSFIPCPELIPKELTVQYWFDKNNVSYHPNSKDYFIPRSGLPKMLSIAEGDDSRKSYKRLHRWRYSPTVAYGNNEVHLHPYKARRLSVAEALALQSAPENFSLPNEMSLTDKFKTIGNGVPYLLSKGIAKTIYEYLKNINI